MITFKPGEEDNTDYIVTVAPIKVWQQVNSQFSKLMCWKQEKRKDLGFDQHSLMHSFCEQKPVYVVWFLRRAAVDQIA